MIWSFHATHFFSLDCDGEISLIGNRVCNEENNNPQCQYDGRDCCDHYYTGKWPYVLGDGFCEDKANIPQCHYDGGDCCLDELQFDFCCYGMEDGEETIDYVDPSFCERCQCLDPLKKLPGGWYRKIKVSEYV